MYLIGIFSIFCLTCIEASRVLVCVPTPSFSHQVVFYPLIQELLKKGHEVVFITTDPMYSKEKAPVNLTEISTHDMSYKTWRDKFMTIGATTGAKEDSYLQIEVMAPLLVKSFEYQMQTPEVQELIKKKTQFDLIITEGVCKSVQALSHVFKAPMILMSSLGALQNNYHVIGAPTNPKLLYPDFWTQKLNNMSILDKIKVLWDAYRVDWFYSTFRREENKIVKRLFGPDTPTLDELGGNVHMLFLNLYPIWDMNRPVPPSVVYIGGIHQKLKKDLPKELKSYLDSSKRGVVFFSLGTNVNPSVLPQEKVQIVIKALSRLPYDVLMKWDSDELPRVGNNTKVATWFPQSDLLRHPNIKAFITQGGLQSFDEAMTGGVPLVGIPMLADQWYNVEMFTYLKVGVGLLMAEASVDSLVNAVHTVIDNPSYRRNMIKLRNKVRDQPQTGLERAVWWTEHVLRHKGAGHLRAPAANMSWAEYLDLELMAALALAALTVLAAAVTALFLLMRIIDLKSYLDSSKRGVVYFSFGTNVSPSTMAPEKVQALIKAFSKLPFDVLMKWDSDELPGVGNNIKVAKWLPQSDLLRHPNIKAFVTQGGLQSFDEALTGGVPLVGIPILGDQWFNVEMYASLKIGVGLLMEELTEDKLVNAVNTVIDDANYRRTICELRDKLRDQPQSALERAVWWTEHVLRHKGAGHLRAPAANMSWAEYLDLELMAVLALTALIVLAIAAVALYLLVRFVKRTSEVTNKLKDA